MAVPRTIILASIASVLTIVGAVGLFYAMEDPVILALAFFLVPTIWMSLVLARILSVSQRVIGAGLSAVLAALATWAFFSYQDPMVLVFGILLILATWGALSLAGIVRLMQERPA